MKFLYVTDLHGSQWKYHKILVEAVCRKVDAVVHGGDMLPKQGMLTGQTEFLIDYLDGYLDGYDNYNIEFICNLGNDDLIINDELLDSICDRHPHAHNVTQRVKKVRDHEFIGFDLVADTPFRLKDRNRMDHADAPFPEQFGTGLISSQGRWSELDDWIAYARTLPTIEDELKKLVKPMDPSKAIYLIHMPPDGQGFATCLDGREVGSRAVTEFILKMQPLLTFHGHIHESPDMTGSWFCKIGETIAIQPGQMEDLCFVEMDTSTMEFGRSQMADE